VTGLPTAPVYGSGPNRASRQWIALLAWALLALPALYQLFLLVTAIIGRVGYPYDLEWMEGGLLHHALRLQNGHGIYSPPSIEFIPYLYTPLYPAVLATLGKLFGITYALGRAISVLSLVGIAVVAFTSIAGSRHDHVARGPALVGALLGLGLFAAAYPYMEGWYDLVRADSLFLFIVTAGLAAAAHWPSEDDAVLGHARTAAIAVILTLGFFTKQTGIFYVGLGGAIVLLLDWRKAVTFVAVAGALGLGATAVMNAATDGWFWSYISKIHRAHDFNPDRFWKSFSNILGHFWPLTFVVIVTLGVVLYTWLRPPKEGEARALPRQTRPFLLWTAAFVVSTLVGAVGWGTEFAHFNAYMPAFLHGGLAAGAALPALAACVAILWGDRREPQLARHAAPAIAAIAIGVSLLSARWRPDHFIPSANDAVAGDLLVAHLKSIEGEVWMPSHPWYLVLAGKNPYVHRMGIKDVTTRQNRVVLGLDDALRGHAFAAIIFDDRDLFSELPMIRQYYRPGVRLPSEEQPHVYTGAQVVPSSLWVPALPAIPPKGVRVVFDFEQATWDGWTRSGPAWGDGPTAEPLAGQGLVAGATGQRFASSMHGGDAATGRMTSPSFKLEGSKISMKLGGGSDSTKLRVELWVEGAIARTASTPLPDGDQLRTVSWDISELDGKTATIVLVDDATARGGHLDVDDVWLWP